MINDSECEQITRREFTNKLGAVGVGLGALGLAGCGPRNQDKGASETIAQKRLRKLGKTDLVLSTLGFGAQHTRDADLVRYALDQGVNHIETASR
jgi:hypothetical protein